MLSATLSVAAHFGRMPKAASQPHAFANHISTSVLPRYRVICVGRPGGAIDGGAQRGASCASPSRHSRRVLAHGPILACPHQGCRGVIFEFEAAELAMPGILISVAMWENARVQSDSTAAALDQAVLAREIPRLGHSRAVLAVPGGVGRIFTRTSLSPPERPVPRYLEARKPATADTA